MKRIKIRTIDIEIAMMEHLDYKTNVIVPNISWPMDGLHECDLLSLSKTGYATEIEIKVSKADLLKDKEKRHRHNDILITYFYFAVPEILEDFALENIPKDAGLFVIRLETYGYNDPYPYNVTKLRACHVKACKKRSNSIKWDNSQRNKLMRLGTMRILRLKKKIVKGLDRPIVK